MNDFLNEIWFDNSIRTYLIVCGVILFAWLFRPLLSRYFAGLLFGVVHRIWKNVDKPAFTSLVGKSAQTDHLFPVEPDHPFPVEPDHPFPVQTDHPLEPHL